MTQRHQRVASWSQVAEKAKDDQSLENVLQNYSWGCMAIGSTPTAEYLVSMENVQRAVRQQTGVDQSKGGNEL